jgi:hypothetical protein
MTAKPTTPSPSAMPARRMATTPASIVVDARAVEGEPPVAADGDAVTDVGADGAAELPGPSLDQPGGSGPGGAGCGP